VAVRYTLLTALAASLIAGTPLLAHHSFSAYYFEEQSVTITGQVTEVVYRSPHTIVMIAAKDPEGRLRTYAAEFASPTRLARQGFTKDTLKPGDVIVITGSPGRKASEFKIHLKQLQRPSDGFSWGGGQRRR
jgi:hypothetical protein